MGVEALGEEFDDDRVEVFTASISEGLELGLEFGGEGDGHGEEGCGRCLYFSGFTMVCDRPLAIVCAMRGGDEYAGLKESANHDAFS
jgi:hypothetical protein